MKSKSSILNDAFKYSAYKKMFAEIKYPTKGLGFNSFNSLRFREKF